MHYTCPMANGPKIVSLAVTAAVIVVLSSFHVLPTTDAQNLAENCNTTNNVHPEEIFILAGQSNMAGRGGLMWNSQLQKNYFDPVWTPLEDQPDKCMVFRLNAQLGWEVAKDPLHVDIDPKVCGVGPGMSFANAIKGKVGTTIGLVPCAVGETSISMWQRGGGNLYLYNNMIKRAKASVQGGGKIKALLWYQGEYDSCNMTMVNEYKGKMEKLILNVREDLNLPSLPVIQVALATGNKDYMESLRTVQKSINLPNMVTIDAKGLPTNGVPDTVHLSKEGQVLLGHMLAKAYLDHFHASA